MLRATSILTAASLCVGLGGHALAETSLSFSLGFGGQVTPDYFGSDTYSFGPAGSFSPQYLKLGRVEFGDPDPNAVQLGFYPRGSFRLIGERSASDNPELAGLEDVDLSVEVGGGLGFRSTGFQAFADLRYGVVGHESFVAEVGAEAILRPAQDVTLTLGPRALWGSDDFAQTYFGVTAAEAAGSAFTEYDPGSGLVSAGVEAALTYDVNEDWAVRGTATWERFVGDAAESPILEDEDAFGLSIVAIRSFSF
ncbi:MAG: MipA/OmpV family protein [Pseudomonadota bacterium]